MRIFLVRAPVEKQTSRSLKAVAKVTSLVSPSFTADFFALLFPLPRSALAAR